MAIVIESYSSADWSGITNGSSKTITKPTGLAEGDLMLAIIGMIDEDATALTCTPPTGWGTVFDNVGNSASGSNGSIKIFCFSRIATSGDASASDFSFVNGSGEDAGMSGIIYRITGAGSPTHIQYASDEDNSGGGTTETFTNTLTPNYSNGYLFFIAVGIDSTGDHTASGYAITNNNPIWTEAADYGSDGSLFAYFGAGNGACPHFAVAHASRPETTATGNSSYTLSNNTNYVSGVMMFLLPQQNVTVNGVTGTMTFVGNAGTVAGGANITGSTGTLSFSGNAGTFSSPANDWINQSKNSSSWTNQSKS